MPCPDSISEISNLAFVSTIQGNNALSNTTAPLPACQPNVAHPVVYSYVSPRTTYYTISTNGTSFDTVLLITTTAQDCFDTLACNDDVVGSFTSFVNVMLYEGMAYKIFLYGFGDYSYGDYMITVSTIDRTVAPTSSVVCPPNAVFNVRPITISAIDPPIVTSFPALMSSMPSLAFYHSCQGNIQNPQFFDLTNALGKDINIELTTMSSSYDTVMAVFADVGCSMELACNDDDFRDFSSFISLKLTAGQQVRVAVSAFQDRLTGTLSLTVLTNSGTTRRAPMALPLNGSYMIDRTRGAHQLCFASPVCSCEVGWGGDSCSIRKPVTVAPTVFDLTQVKVAQSDPVVLAFLLVVFVPIGLVILGFIVKAIRQRCCGPKITDVTDQEEGMDMGEGTEQSTSSPEQRRPQQLQQDEQSGSYIPSPFSPFSASSYAQSFSVPSFSAPSFSAQSFSPAAFASSLGLGPPPPRPARSVPTPPAPPPRPSPSPPPAQMPDPESEAFTIT